MHIRELADEAALSANEAGGKGVVFNTISISDGISMGTSGMRSSLVSREIIADSIEAVTAAEGFDGLVAIGLLRLRLRRLATHFLLRKHLIGGASDQRQDFFEPRGLDVDRKSVV